MRGYLRFSSIFIVVYTINFISVSYAESMGAAAKPSVELYVELNPMGSFVAKSEALTAEGASAEKGVFKAEKIELKLDTLKTGISLRDEHMTKKYFETGKYPLATMTNLLAANGKFKADLNIHNKTKSVEGTYSVVGKTASVEFTCALSDFDIASAKYMGVGVEDRVKVKVKVDIPAEITTPAPAIVEKPVEMHNN